jgi:hypothetical protein
MKSKIIIGLVAAALGSTAAYAADKAMDCCKDGKCSCCDHDKDAPKK